MRNFKIRRELYILRQNYKGIIHPTLAPKIKITKKTKELIDKVMKVLVTTPHLHSIYIRGSLNFKNFTEGFSDIDFVIVTNRCLKKEMKRNLIAKLAAVEKEQCYFTKIDHMWLTKKEAISGPFSILLKLGSTCLYGLDVVPEIDDISLTKGINLTIMFLEREIKDLEEQNFRSDQYSVKMMCVWIMKRLLRAGVEIICSETGEYSRDLYTCYHIFSKAYPRYKKSMFKALKFALFPTKNREKIKKLVKLLGTFICKEYKIKIANTRRQ